MGDVVDRFFAEEANEYVRGRLAEALPSRTAGSSYLTFNVFNVRIDFDQGIATVEDELDPAKEEALSLEDLRTRLGR